jgi:hypothetical protein
MATPSTSGRWLFLGPLCASTGAEESGVKKTEAIMEILAA